MNCTSIDRLIASIRSGEVQLSRTRARKVLSEIDATIPRLAALRTAIDQQVTAAQLRSFTRVIPQ